MLTPFSSLLLAVLAVAAAASALASLSLQEPATGDEASLPFHKVDAQEVPDFLAWREFFDSVKSHYEYGETSFFLFMGKRVGLKREEALRILDFAYQASAARARFAASLGAPDEMRLSRVKALKKICFDMEDALDPATFAKLQSYVTGPYKKEFGYFMQGTPGDMERLKIFQSFDRLSRADVRDY